MRVDAALVRRIEATAARQATLLAASMRARSPESGADSTAHGSGAFISLGAGRYVNRAIGIGLEIGSGALSPAETLDALELFSANHGVAATLEVCPWTSSDFVAELASRGYRVEWFRNVFARLPSPLPARLPSAFQFIEVTEETKTEWSVILGEATAPASAARRVNDEFCDAGHAVPGEQDLLATLDGRPVACGSWNVIDGVGWLGAAATLSGARRRGAQRALINERLRRIAGTEATLVVATALPDGQSARNLVDLGFSVLYTQAVMTRQP
ncbi:MAG: GNAT family N-acetyltransferase [Ilumatobacteraceae bacterium]